MDRLRCRVESFLGGSKQDSDSGSLAENVGSDSLKLNAVFKVTREKGLEGRLQGNIRLMGKRCCSGEWLYRILRLRGLEDHKIKQVFLEHATRYGESLFLGFQLIQIIIGILPCKLSSSSSKCPYTQLQVFYKTPKT